MLPLLIFGTVIVCAVGFFALLLGAAAGGVWEALEERSRRRSRPSSRCDRRSSCRNVRTPPRREPIAPLCPETPTAAPKGSRVAESSHQPTGRLRACETFD